MFNNHPIETLSRATTYGNLKMSPEKGLEHIFEFSVQNKPYPVSYQEEVQLLLPHFNHCSKHACKPDIEILYKRLGTKDTQFCNVTCEKCIGSALRLPLKEAHSMWNKLNPVYGASKE